MRAVKLRWLFATGVALAFALLTLPGVPGVSFDTGPAAVAGFDEAPVCDQDAKPASLDFALKDMDGKDVNLASYRGKVILVNFWATWCGPCKIEIPGFVELQNEYGDQGLVVLGVSIDDPASLIKPFAEEYKVNYPLLVGLDREDFLDAYGPIWGIPTTVFISRDGMKCTTHAGMATKEHFEEEIKALL